MTRLDRAYIEVDLKRWSDIFSLHYRFLNNFIFRGQDNNQWELQTPLERCVNTIYPNLIDKSLFPQ